MDMKELLKKTAEQGKWIAVRESGGKTNLQLDLPSGRKQSVEVSTHNENGLALGRFKTKIGSVKELTGNRPLMALKMNANMTFGSFAIDGDDLILVESFLLMETTPAHLLQSLMYLAKTADQQEKNLSGGSSDKH